MLVTLVFIKPSQIALKGNQRGQKELVAVSPIMKQLIFSIGFHALLNTNRLRIKSPQEVSLEAKNQGIIGESTTTVPLITGWLTRY